MSRRVQRRTKWGHVLVFVLAVCLLLALEVPAARAADAKKGKAIVEERSLGNCMACHYLPDVEFPGDIGPNLVEAMKAYSEQDREIVRQWIRDARKFNPDTIMPPFLTNNILTEEQVEDAVEYLYSLKNNKEKVQGK